MSDNAELLAAAQVALNRHADVLGELGTLFADAGHELYLVGGSVRDALLGRLGTDLDFTTDARPEQIQRMLRPWADALWDTGIEYGTVGVGKGDQRMEITTFRADTYDQVSRNPEVRFGDRLDDDLVRRDFTVNAMAVRITRDGPGEFLDPLGGLAALHARVLDTPAAPEVSFGDDPLRMLRAARFVSQLGFAVAPRVREAMAAMAGQLERITAERVAAELDKLILGSDPVAGINLMVESGLGDVVLPEVGAMRMAIDEHHQHKDVYQHSLTVLRQAIGLEDDSGSEGPDLVLRWAALLHDIGKPATRRHEADGGVSFHHHEVVGRQDDPQADAGAEVLQADGRRRVAAGVSASAFPRLADASGAASGPTRRCVAMSPMRARCCLGCTSWCVPTAPPATSAARRGCRPTTTIWRHGSPSWRRRRTSSGCGRTWTATRSWRFSAFRPGRRSARRGAISRNCGWTVGRSATTRPRPNC